MALTAPQYTLQSGYCMSGVYRGYRGDSIGTAGSTKQMMDAIATLIGWPIEVITVGGGVNSSLNGVTQHLVVKQAFFPKPSGSNARGSLHLAATSPSTAVCTDGSGQTYQQYWKGAVDALIAQNLNTSQVTLAIAWEGSGDNYWGGISGTDPGTGVAGTKADFKQAFRNCVTYMRSVGLSSAVTIDWNVMTGGYTSTDLDAMYPGDDVVDVIGWDGYAGNHVSAKWRDRTDYQTIFNVDQKLNLDVITNYARAHGKLAGMGEYGFIANTPAAEATIDPATDYTVADTDLYFKLFSQYFATNADIWAYVCMFNQNQPYNSYNGTADITEDDQLVYLGTNPASQTYPRIYSTNMSGPAYMTTSGAHTISGPSWVNWMQAGSMQLADMGSGGGTSTFVVAPPARKVYNSSILFG